jgi:hypothetical protein
MNIIRLILIGLFMALVVPSHSFADNRVDKVKAVFLYKFMDYVRWATTDSTTKQTLCFYPNAKFTDVMKQINKIENYKYTIKNPTQKNDIQNCHLLYLTNGDSSVASTVKGVLTVSDRPQFAVNGGMIEMNKTANRIQLTVNIPAVQKADLTMSSRLLDVADIIR